MGDILVAFVNNHYNSFLQLVNSANYLFFAMINDIQVHQGRIAEKHTPSLHVKGNRAKIASKSSATPLE